MMSLNKYTLYVLANVKETGLPPHNDPWRRDGESSYSSRTIVPGIEKFLIDDHRLLYAVACVW